MTVPSSELPAHEAWPELITFDDEPFFPAHLSITESQSHAFTTGYHIPESVTSEQPYMLSAPPSVVDGVPSLENVSCPPSINDGSFPVHHAHSTSPPFAITTSSSFLGQDEGQCFGSFGAFDGITWPIDCMTKSPVLDTRFKYIQDSLDASFRSSEDTSEDTSEAVFNPHVVGSSFPFSGLDITASQAFSSVGTWADQPQISEPILESEETNTQVGPVPGPRPVSSHTIDSHPYRPQSNDNSVHETRSRAITIPGVSPKASTPKRTPRITALSAPPIAHRRASGFGLSKSASQARSRLASSSSPTLDSHTWVSYQPSSWDPVTNRLAAMSTESPQGRIPRGRKRGLTQEQRSQAALMRIIGACSNCKLRKEKCDPRTPCKSCLEHFKGGLINHPCRNHRLRDIANALLSERYGWHPIARSIESFLAPYDFSIRHDKTYSIPLIFGFGPPLYISVHAIEIENHQRLSHNHIVYSWPPRLHHIASHTHAVLPATLTPDATSTLKQTLDDHISLLVTHHFRAFPLYCSPLRVLREVYIFFRSLPPNAHSRILHQALKLLVLVHIGGDVTLPSPTENPTLAQLIQTTMNIGPDSTPAPCFIRSQLGSVMPALALKLMKSILASLEPLLLSRDHDEWPLTLAILTTVLFTVESIQYHAAKLPYHFKHDASRPSGDDEKLDFESEGVKILLEFYHACFVGCHARLRPEWEGEVSCNETRQGEKTDKVFVDGVRRAIRESGVEYLKEKARAKRQGDEMEFFFDRLVARLLIFDG